MTKMGSLLVGVAAGAVAVVWVIKDRLLGPEAAPVRPEEASAFRVAPKNAPTDPAADADDLSEVKGIGPVYAGRLEEAGITTFAALAAATPERIADVAQVTEERAGDWRSQAAALVG